MSCESQKSPPRPPGLTTIGWLFIIAGASAALSMVWGALHGRINLNLAVLMLPVGLGLHRGRASSITWARFWTGLGILGCSMVLLLYALVGDKMHVRLFWTELEGVDRHVFAVALPSGCIVLGLWSWRVLGATVTHQFMTSRDSTFGTHQR